MLDLQLPQLFEGVDNELKVSLRSFSTERVNIAMVKADCACTGGRITNPTLNYEDESILYLRIRPKSYGGEFQSTVNLVTVEELGASNPHGCISLILRATVKSLAKVSPSTIIIDRETEIDSVPLRITCEPPAVRVLAVSPLQSTYLHRCSWDSETSTVNLSISPKFRNHISEVNQQLKVELEMANSTKAEVVLNVGLRAPEQIRIAPSTPEFIQSDEGFSARVAVSFLSDIDNDNLAIEVGNDLIRIPVDFSIVQSVRNLRIIRIHATDFTRLKPDSKDHKSAIELSEIYLFLFNKEPRTEIFRCACRLIE